MATTTLFLLSPARCGGPRAELLASSTASALGQALRGPGAAIGDVFAWLSALYFRGKLTYARAFTPPTARHPRAFVMAPGAGLCPPDATITAEVLRAMGSVRIESDAFVEPLRRDAKLVDARYPTAQVVLLGSIATGKYVDVLLTVFGERLVFPSAFVGRGDMSRGGLLLRAARAGEELAYTPVMGAVRHGPRPPKLPRQRPRPARSAPDLRRR
jgi:hypothetical protein